MQDNIPPNQASEVTSIARQHVGHWIDIELHQWASLYAWQNSPLFNSYGDITGNLKANTIYIYSESHCPEEDLLHELGHFVARKYNLIGHHQNGFLGKWENRQRRLVGSVKHHRHWSRLLVRVRQHCAKFTPELCSEIWAELFMCWYLYPERREVTFISQEMQMLAHHQELRDISDLVNALSKTTPHQ